MTIYQLVGKQEVLIMATMGILGTASNGQAIAHSFTPQSRSPFQLHYLSKRSDRFDRVG
jgi:hypothetical protein